MVNQSNDSAGETTPPEGLRDHAELTERLAAKRKNATVVDASAAQAPTSIENTVAKAKAMRTVTSKGEGKILDGNSVYRESK